AFRPRPWGPRTEPEPGSGRAVAARSEPWPRRAAPGPRPARRPGFSSAPALEGGADAPAERRGLVRHLDVERRALDDGALPGDAYGRVGPQPTVGAVPAQDRGLEPQAIARGEHDVAPNPEV